MRDGCVPSTKSVVELCELWHVNDAKRFQQVKRYRQYWARVLKRLITQGIFLGQSSNPRLLTGSPRYVDKCCYC